MSLVIHPDGDTAIPSVSSVATSLLRLHSHEQGLTEAIRDLQQGGVECVEPKATSHQRAEIRSTTVRDVGSEAKEEK